MRKAAVVLAIVVAAVAFAAAAVPRLVSMDAYRPRVAAAILERTGRAPSFSKISLNLLPTVSIHLSDFTLSGPPSLPAERFLIAPKAEFRVALLPLLAGRNEFSTFLLHRPRITVRRFRDGTLSAADVLERLGAQDAPAPGGAFGPTTSVVLKGARIEDGTLSVIHEEENTPEFRTEISPFSLRISGMGEPAKRFTLEASIRKPAEGKVTLTGNALRNAAGTGGGGLLFRAEGKAFGQKFTAQGTLGAPTGAPEADLSLSFPKVDVGRARESFRELWPVLSDWKAQGVATVSVRLAGDFKSLGFEVEADLTRTGWTVAEGVQKFIDSPCTLILEGHRFPGVVAVSNAELRFPPLLLMANATFSPSTGVRDWALSARVSDLADFAKARGEGFTKWSPSGRFVLSGKGRKEPGAEGTYILEADLAGVGLSFPGRRFALSGFKGHVDVTPGSVEFSPLAGLVNGQRFLIRGKVGRGETPAGEVELRMGYLDLDELLPAGERTGTRKNGADVTATLEEWDERLAFYADVSIDAGNLWGVEFRGLSGHVRREKGTFTFEGIRATLFGGEVLLSGGLGKPGDGTGLRARVSARDVELSEFLGAVSSLEDYLSGKGTLSLDIAGSRKDLAEFLRTAEGKGSLRIQDGKLGGVDLLARAAAAVEGRKEAAPAPGETAFREVSAHLAVGGGKVRFTNLQMTSGSMEVDGDAVVGLADHGLELFCTLWLSRELSTGLPWSGRGFPVSAEKRVGVPLLVSGTLRNPSVAVDTTALGRTPGRMLRPGVPGGRRR